MARAGVLSLPKRRLWLAVQNEATHAHMHEEGWT
jgi:hypothetical protein